MVRVEVNKHAEIIKQQVFHTFPYNAFIPNFKGPHADDCPGCIIEAELKILVDKIAELSPVEDIVEELEREKAKNAVYTEARESAFAIADVEDDGTRSLVDLVESLVNERDRLDGFLTTILEDLNEVTSKLKRG